MSQFTPTSSDQTRARDGFMIGEYPNRRASKRKFVRLPAWVIFYRTNQQKHVAMVRDISRQGIFFYSDVQPAAGDEIEFVIKFPKWTNSPPIACKGTVVRVEHAAPGAAVGIAASLYRFVVLN
jgi:PilZ domain